MSLLGLQQNNSHIPSTSTRSRAYGESKDPVGEKSMVGTGSSMPLVSKGNRPCIALRYTCRLFRSAVLKARFRLWRPCMWNKRTKAWPWLPEYSVIFDRKIGLDNISVFQEAEKRARSGDIQNSFRRTISTIVAPYAYNMSWRRFMCEKLVLARKLACSDTSDGGNWTISSFRVLIRLKAPIHSSV